MAALNAHIETFLRQHQTHHAENNADGQKSLSLSKRGLTWSKIATCLSFVAAMGTVGSAAFALLQLQEARNEARPWLMLSEVVPDHLSTDDEDGVNFWARLLVKNVGHLPAENVFVTYELVLDELSHFPDREMARVCRAAYDWHASGFIFFPEQPPQGIDGDSASNFSIDASKVWAARAKRIASIRTRGREKRAVDAETAEISAFPFYDRITFVGCINYQSSRNSGFYQTSFAFDMGSFPLLGGVKPPELPPTPVPGDPDAMEVHERMMQRAIPGIKIKLSQPLYAIFAR